MASKSGRAELLFHIFPSATHVHVRHVALPKETLLAITYNGKAGSLARSLEEPTGVTREVINSLPHRDAEGSAVT